MVGAEHCLCDAAWMGTGLKILASLAFLIAVVSPAGQLAPFGTHEPGYIVFGRLMAMRAIQSGGLLLRFFVEKVSLVHG